MYPNDMPEDDAGSPGHVGTFSQLYYVAWKISELENVIQGYEVVVCCLQLLNLQLP